MPLDRSIKRVLVLGAGPVVIGQAAEFDYSGSQACLSLKDEGITAVLLNPNPATIQTDHSIADRVYIEPISQDSIREIIEKEEIDSIMSAFGGQTALNALLEVISTNGLDRRVKVLGTQVDGIRAAENREKFHEIMKSIGEPVPDSAVLDKENYRSVIDEVTDGSYIVRTSFSLGGSGGIIVNGKEDLSNYAVGYFSENPADTLEIEQSVLGLKEIEYEVIRDSADNCITICNMENIDPMGVHTGESIVVTPCQTLSDLEIQLLRSSALKIARALKIVGACNVQFAIDAEGERYYVIEVNPRTSRSSALASKASGYPIARISAKIQLGYNLPEIKNPLIGHTSAAFEPSLDYITVKIPRWPFDKITVNREIGVQMRSVGEVMGIGSTFEEALMKAIVSLDTNESRKIRMYKPEHEIIDLLSRPNDLRLFAVFEALTIGVSVDTVCQLSGYEQYFVRKIEEICRILKRIEIGKIPENLRELKSFGIPDQIIAHYSRIPELELTKARIKQGIFPAFRTIDTCSAEFESSTPYLYSTCFGEDEVVVSDFDKKVLILGSGPNRIAQGLEFDYGSVKAARSFIDLGYETLMVNCNPETVSTDFDFSSKLYFEPLTLEHISNIIAVEKLPKVMIQFSGQTGQNLSIGLSEIFGDDIFIGTSPHNILRIEDRGKFANSLKQLGISQPDFVVVQNEMDAVSTFDRIKLPVIIRSSFIIGGRSMDVVFDRNYGIRRIVEVLKSIPEFPVLISQFIENATEIDVDFVSDGTQHVIGGISVHLEEAGTHSGDAISVLGPELLPEDIIKEIDMVVSELTRHFDLVGISNLQLALNESGLQIIELNARSSRSVPYVCKATGVNLVDLGVRMALGIVQAVPDLVQVHSYFSKIPVFPFRRFPEADILLSPEMKSTGEGLGIGKTIEESLLKAFLIQNPKFSANGGCIISVNDSSKAGALEIAKELRDFGHPIYSTPGTHRFFREHGLESVLVFKLEDQRRPNLRDILENQSIFLVLNLPNPSPGSIADGFQIRRMALARNIPILTNMKVASALVAALVRKPEMVSREISEYISQGI